MKNILLKFFFCVFIYFVSIPSLFATHAAGMDISFECIARNSTSDFYKITVSFYRDCNNTAAPGSMDIDFTSSCGSGSQTMLLSAGPTYITPTCTQSGTPCSGTSSLVEIEEYKYEKLITLDHCDDWTFTVCIQNRNNAITTILQPGNEQLCVQAELNNLNFCNNSPTFTEYPAPYICVNEPFCYNNGAFDIDGDSLVYSLVTPLGYDFGTGNVSNVQFLPGYSVANPISGTTTFDPSSGNLCMTANTTDIGIVAMKISEYRNGVFVGSVIRDIQIIILPCTTVPPVLSGFNGFPANVTNSTSLDDSLNLCADFGDTISFTIDASIGSSNNKIMSWSGLASAPAATFDIVNNFSNNPTGTFFWIPQSSDVVNNPFSFNITVQDDACPINNVFSYTYTITLSSSSTFIVNATVNDESCYGYGDGSIQLTVNGTDSIPQYNWIGPNGYTNPNEDINGIRSGLYNLTITDISGCYLQDSFIISSPNPVSVSFNVDSISCSGFNDGAINMTTTGFSSFANVVWYARTPPILFGQWYLFSGDEDIDSLVPGIYAVQIADTINNNLCIFYDTLEILDANPYNASYNINEITCKDGNDGFIDLNVSGNTSSLVYNWTGTNGFSNNTQDIFQLSSGIYVITITNPNGCIYNDSIELVNPPELISVSNISSCYSYLWNGITYNSSGNYVWSGVNSSGCDSTATLNLNIYDSSSVDIFVNTCDNYLWNGINYDSTGIYYWQGVNINGCDSNVYLNLTINTNTYNELSINTCSSYSWNGIDLNQTGVYYDTLLNFTGCDSIIKLNLFVSEFSISAVSPICENDSTTISLLIEYPTTNDYSILINNYSFNVDSLGLLYNSGDAIKLNVNNSQDLVLLSVSDNTCTTNPYDSAYILVNELPSLNISLENICDNIDPFVFSQAEPIGGILTLDNLITDTIFPNLLSLGTHSLCYFYTDSTTGCSNTVYKDINVLESPNAAMLINPEVGKTDSLISFTNLSSNFVNNSWSLGDGFYISEENTFDYSYSEFGQYLVELSVYAANNCVDLASNYVTVYPTYSVYLPNSFSPDSDRINDNFSPVGIGIFSYEIIIINRWGDLIFSDENTPWTAKNVPQGLYTYIINLKDYNDQSYSYKGTVRVIK